MIFARSRMTIWSHLGCVLGVLKRELDRFVQFVIQVAAVSVFIWSIVFNSTTDNLYPSATIVAAQGIDLKSMPVPNPTSEDAGLCV